VREKFLLSRKVNKAVNLEELIKKDPEVADLKESIDDKVVSLDKYCIF
jgi:hypothetical protein